VDRQTKLHVAKALLAAADRLTENAIRADFADLNIPKNKWTRLTVDDLRDDPELQDELFELIQNAYRQIGGHFKLRNPIDLLGGEVVFFDAADIDADPEADALNLVDTKKAGEKYVGMGHDDTSLAKKAVVKHKADLLLRKKGVFAEVSDAIAHILLTRHHVPTVNDPETAKKVLNGKKIEWVGEHPSGKYPDNPGWYYRDIAGHRHMKIIVGHPRT